MDRRLTPDCRDRSIDFHSFGVVGLRAFDDRDCQRPPAAHASQRPADRSRPRTNAARSQGRSNYVTPRHFLDFIAQFVKLLGEKRAALEEEQLHLTGRQRVRSNSSSTDARRAARHAQWASRSSKTRKPTSRACKASWPFRSRAVVRRAGPLGRAERVVSVDQNRALTQKKAEADKTLEKVCLWRVWFFASNTLLRVCLLSQMTVEQRAAEDKKRASEALQKQLDEVQRNESANCA